MEQNNLEAKVIKTIEYLSVDEIKKQLLDVEYVIMATPSPEYFGDSPIHFTIFLNTSDALPKDIAESVLDKFLKENSITSPKELMSQVMPVGFSKGLQDTPMPMLLIKPQDVSSVPNIAMYVMDFLADSTNFDEAKFKKLTGWTYSYN